MSAPLKYAMAGLALIGSVTLLLWPVLDPSSLRGVVTAGLVALPVQVLAFWLLHRFHDRVNGFLAVWAGGTLVRMGVVAVCAFVVIRNDQPGAMALLLSLAGFFFGLLLLEPLYFRPGRRNGTGTI